MTQTPTSRPLSDAHARGLAARERLLHQAGPMLEAAEVAQRLGTDIRDIERQHAAGALLAVEIEGERRYPACQLTDAGVVPGLRTFLAAFNDANGWTKLSVLLAPSRRHDGRSALDLLKAGDLKAATGIAARHGEHLG